MESLCPHYYVKQIGTTFNIIIMTFIKGDLKRNLKLLISVLWLLINLYID